MICISLVHLRICCSVVPEFYFHSKFHSKVTGISRGEGGVIRTGRQPEIDVKVTSSCYVNLMIIEIGSGSVCRYT